MNDKYKRMRALFFAFALVLTLALAACKTEVGGNEETQSPAPPDGDAPFTTIIQPAPGVAAQEEQTLVVGCDFFSMEFSPFFAKTTSDRQVAVDMTQLLLVKSDRAGRIITDGISGEAAPFNGIDYFYSGPADIKIARKTDGKADYNITIRDDLLFSDGVPVTIDDVIFSMYVYLDPAYDGPSRFSSLPISGARNYHAGVSPEIYEKYGRMAESIIAAGPYNTDYSLWTQAQQEAFWGEYLDTAGALFIQEIVDYCVANFPSSLELVNNNEAALGMYLRGFADFDGDGAFVTINGMEYDLQNGQGPDIADFWDELLTEYGLDLSDDGINAESLGSDIKALATEAFISGESTKDPEAGVEPSGISGIRKTGPFSCAVTVDYFEAASIHLFAFAIAPLHYYGDASLYDYDRNMFGFPRGDLSGVKAKSALPVGAGPYKFLSYDSGAVTFEANENYYRGGPKIKYIRFQETGDADMLAGIVSGSLDISAPAFTEAISVSIKQHNSNGELTGDKITTIAYDFPGYGYIGISAEAVKVGDDPGSRESKALRAAFATLYAVSRETVIAGYFAERASIIQYPVSNASWIAPRPGDEGYRIAYSTDIDGRDIFSSAMGESEKNAAALEAAIGFLKAAGYTWDEASGIFTDAPPGARMAYEMIIPAGGTGVHPSYGILTAAKEALLSIGLTLEIKDPADANDLWKAIESCKAEMWAAAWEVSGDPDMHLSYHSSNIASGGATGTNYFALNDELLDMLIVDARKSDDQAYRKSIYGQCIDIILDWAVEVPIYQRKEAVLFSSDRVKPESVTPDITSFWTWLNDL